MKTTMTRSEWLKTPYAKSSARDPDGAIQKLLGKYGIADSQWTVGTGPGGRRAVMLRFARGGKGYRVMLESLDADAGEDELLRQVKRAVFHFLKGALEAATVFVTAEEALFAFLELPNGVTMIEGARQFMDRLEPPDFGLLLPPPVTRLLTKKDEQ